MNFDCSTTLSTTIKLPDLMINNYIKVNISAFTGYACSGHNSETNIR
jgi:hypothetical protein